MTLELWVRVECLCGRAAAIPEGGMFPLCGGCGRRMAVPRGERLSMVCEPMETTAAVGAMRERQAGLEPPLRVRDIPGHARVYTDEGLRADLESRGFPTESCDFWPQKEMPDGLMTRVPPWEA